ncbi:MAG TPA: hypothetical protein P5114_12495 [Hyphomicrobiaceae bacterium]|nr:hypothetical protein [Hyphomicrobiaceae bacterium]
MTGFGQKRFVDNLPLEMGKQLAGSQGELILSFADSRRASQSGANLIEAMSCIIGGTMK